MQGQYPPGPDPSVLRIEGNRIFTIRIPTINPKGVCGDQDQLLAYTP